MKALPSNFVFFRLPHQEHYNLMAQANSTPEVLTSVLDISGREGFVMAPFEPSPSHPVLLMQPDMVEERVIEAQELAEIDDFAVGTQSGERKNYEEVFACFHNAVVSGQFSKLVLARTTEIDRPESVDLKQLFLKACHLYPRAFVALVSMPQVGTWLMATPEILLEGHANCWQTMALAGTMKRPNGLPEGCDAIWSDKDKEEQGYVSTYISDTLHRFAKNVSSDGPYTAVAAHLVHLRTDFSICKSEVGNVGELIDALYPTPAVCGIPKEQARAFIFNNESVSRRYYSGFCGPISPSGNTHLYVSLRCMEIMSDRLRLYAGSGILGDSTVEGEWQETQSKLQTMLRLLR